MATAPAGTAELSGKAKAIIAGEDSSTSESSDEGDTSTELPKESFKETQVETTVEKKKKKTTTKKSKKTKTSKKEKKDKAYKKFLKTKQSKGEKKD